MGSSSIRETGHPILVKERILPILVPSCPRIREARNRFRETNPAIWVTDGSRGSFIGVIRLVSYIKFPNGEFECWTYPVRSLYVGFEGILDRPDEWVFTPLETDYGEYSVCERTHWTGVEDLRFEDDEHLVGVIPELAEDGQPRLFRIRYDRAAHRLRILESLPRFQAMEKNWMPFGLVGQYLYSVSPFRIFNSGKGAGLDTIPIDPSILPSLDGYHGSTNGIEWRPHGSWLFLIHKGREHRFLHFQPPSTVVVSRPFVLFSTSHIEFPLSLSYVQGLLWIALGVNDEYAFLIAVNPFTIPWDVS